MGKSRIVSRQSKNTSGRWRDRFLLAFGGEHTVTYGVVNGLVDDPAEVTVVQIDAHADLADKLEGRHWSHGTVMRRLWEEGCRLVQIGIRSLTREEHQVAAAGPRITTFYAHRLKEQWPEVLATLRGLEGKVYLTIDVDGLDPSIIPSTGTPLPGGLSWAETMEVIRALTLQSPCRLIGSDVVEFVPSPTLPGCDPIAARLATKLLAWWWTGRRAVKIVRKNYITTLFPRSAWEHADRTLRVRAAGRCSTSRECSTDAERPNDAFPCGAWERVRV